MTLTPTNQNFNLSQSSIDTKRDLIKRTFCKGVSDDEFELFLHACKRTGLDPFMKQIYAIKRGAMMTIQTGIDGFRLIAERTGNYSPGREPTFTYDEKNNLTSATAYIKKRTNDGTWHEVAAVAYMDEYNANQGLWKKMPRAMLSKCAESLALRKAFPSEMSGIYTQEEMSQSDNDSPSASYGLSEEQSAQLDSLLLEINDDEYLRKLNEYLKVDNIHEMDTRNFDRTIRSLRNKLNPQVQNESSRVA